MKKIHVLITAAVISIGMMACKNKTEQTSTQNSTVLNAYVDSVEGLTPVYTTAYWADIDRGYQQRLALAEKDYADMSAEEKTRADAIKARYAVLKSRYELKIKENEAGGIMTGTPNNKQAVRDRLFGPGKVGEDLNLSFVTPQNVQQVYKDFVNAVSDNTSIYTKDDWEEISRAYKVLDDRKDAIGNDISAGDKILIEKLKVKYKAIKITN